MTTRRLGGSAPPPPSSAPSHAPVPPQASAPPPRPAVVPAAAPKGPRVLPGAGTLPPPPPGTEASVPRERRDDEYWQKNPLRAGTYEWDLVVVKIVSWLSGGTTITFRVVQWDNAAKAPGPHHDRQITWDQARPDLVNRFENPGEDGERARNGYAAFRGALVAAYTACGWPEDQWPGAPDNPTPPFWLFFVHTCGDGTVVPVTLHAKVVVQPKRERWPVITEIRQILTNENPARPFQAPLPYCVPEALAHEHGWPIGEMKWFSDKAHVALLDREAIAFPHANLPTYKDL